MHIVIPMAGYGNRFKRAGYKDPKPLIKINNKPMIQIVIENINLNANYTFIVLKEHYDLFDLQNILPSITSPNKCQIIIIEEVTQGAICSVLLAKDTINNDEELIIANSDQWVDWNSEHFIKYMRASNADGGILTFTDTNPKWSFAKINPGNNLITEVAEKRHISNNATVGIYYFKFGNAFVHYAEQMINKNIRVNNEFYVCPVFNEFIGDNKKIFNYSINKMRGLGTPEDLEIFLRSNIKI